MTIPAIAYAAPGMPAPPNANQPFEIIGVVGDVKNNGLQDPILPQAYVPSSMLAAPDIGLLIRSSGVPGAALHTIEKSIHSLDRDAAVSDVYAYEDFLSQFAWAYDRFISTLFAVFSAVALGLAAIGLFSVVAYTVEQRTRELGIRIALGASRVNVLMLTLTSIAWTTGLGLALGLGLSIGLSDTFYKWTQSSMRNAGVLSAISLVLLLAAALACLLPARRATRIDPMEALRNS